MTEDSFSLGNSWQHLRTDEGRKARKEWGDLAYPTVADYVSAGEFRSARASSP